MRQPSDGAWTRVPWAAGCLSHSGTREQPANLNIVLTDALKAELLGKVKSLELEPNFCWYETPTGDVMLHAGPDCGLSQIVNFSRSAGSWDVTNVSRDFAQCELHVR